MITGDLPDAQRRFEEILSLVAREIGTAYYVPGNRDRAGRGKNARTLDFSRDTCLAPGKAYDIGEGVRVTSSPDLADGDTVLVQHSNVVYAGRFDRTLAIAGKALLHVAGHTHTGVWTGNYLNTGFLYRDGSNGAEPMPGGYFDVEVSGHRVGVSFNALGPIRRRDLKSGDFRGYVYAPYGRAFPVKLALL